VKTFSEKLGKLVNLTKLSLDLSYTTKLEEASFKSLGDALKLLVNLNWLELDFESKGKKENHPAAGFKALFDALAAVKSVESFNLDLNS